MSTPMIAIEDLKKEYALTKALRGISFEVPKGQVVGFLGPNGAGKSTTMKILTGYVEPTSGSVKVGDVDVTQDPVEARRKIGYLPESNPLYEDMMVEEVLGFAADMRHLAKNERQSRIAGAVERCGLGPVRHKDVSELSKGFRQRVGLACAILHEPDLLILDEPTSGLDPNQVQEIRDLITELGQEKTVLMSTHVLPEVQATCSRVLIIANGQVVADNTPDRLVESAGTIEVELLAREPGAVKESDIRAALSTLPGVKDLIVAPASEEGALAYSLHVGDEDPRTALFDVAVDKGLVLLRLDRQRVSLEDVFRDLTTTDVH